MSRFFQPFVFLIIGLALSGCGPAAKGPAPGSPEKPKVESDLAVTTLTADAFKSLGIVSEPIHTEKVQEFIHLTGWIMAPQCAWVLLSWQ